LLVSFAKSQFWKIGQLILLALIMATLYEYVFSNFHTNLHHHCDRKGTWSGFITYGMPVILLLGNLFLLAVYGAKHIVFRDSN